MPCENASLAMNVALPLACQLSATSGIGKGVTVEAKAVAALKAARAQTERISRFCMGICCRLSASTLTTCSADVSRDDTKRMESVSRRQIHAPAGFFRSP